MIFPFTEKQKQAFLIRFGCPVTIDDKTELGIVEREITNVDGQISETIYITADINKVKQGSKVSFDENNYKIAYIVNDGTGLVNCYLSITSNDKGRISKYE
ncbi:TPA: hypothetical protein MM329_000681 [Escherichia coli]|nr:hypothetical protein [Escherichia coli]HBZ8229047.1 hypothetical protein [Escherichia coli]HBZ8345775.1 hypothetical protein [Escherichia coli]HBZ8350844.1 hypothetical protein [Escherichia coli]HBZ8356176.1 hypothetical protein [Escherichia coli]